MISIMTPARSMARQAMSAQRQFTLSPGLQLRLNARSYVAPAKQQAQRQARAIALPIARSHDATMFSLLGGAGLALYSTSMFSSSLSLESGSILNNGSNKTGNFSFNGAGGDDPLPKSDVSLYNLGFGSVCGICAGVFIKKGLKLVAFLLGGGFVLLQYLNSQRIVNINWRQFSNRYDSVIASAAGEDAVQINKPSSSGGWRDSQAARIWNRFTHFLTADFPSRGTFVAGMLFGLRMG